MHRRPSHPPGLGPPPPTPPPRRGGGGPTGGLTPPHRRAGNGGRGRFGQAAKRMGTRDRRTRAGLGPHPLTPSPRRGEGGPTGGLTRRHRRADIGVRRRFGQARNGMVTRDRRTGRRFAPTSRERVVPVTARLSQKFYEKFGEDVT